MLILGSSANGSAASSGSGTAIRGDLLVLFAQFCYAFYIVYYKDFVRKYSLFTTMKWLFTYAFICILPFSADDLMATRWNELTPQTIAGILFIVIGATFISYMLIVIGQKNLRPTVAGMYNYVQPVVACIVAICCGMESLNLIKAAAVVLIFTGVYLVTASKSRQDLENHDQQL
jgi:drug/metabolite transporter (DMT)-like permease